MRAHTETAPVALLADAELHDEVEQLIVVGGDRGTPTITLAPGLLLSGATVRFEASGVWVNREDVPPEFAIVCPDDPRGGLHIASADMSGCDVGRVVVGRGVHLARLTIDEIHGDGVGLDVCGSLGMARVTSITARRHAVRIQTGAEVGELEVTGSLITDGDSTTTVQVDGQIGHLSVRGRIVATGLGSRPLSMNGTVGS